MPVAGQIFFNSLTLGGILVPLIILAITSLAFTLYRSAKRQSNIKMDAVDPNAGSQSSSHGVTNIHAIIADLKKFWRTQTHNKDIKLTVHCDPDISPRLKLDSLMVYNALAPLVARAHHRTQSGRIHIHITQSNVNPLSDQDGVDGNLEIIVADTGNGSLKKLSVGRETKFHIFNLNKVQQYVSSLNGQIICNTRKGTGTEIIINIPFTVKAFANENNLEQSLPHRAEPKYTPKSLSELGQSSLSDMIDINTEVQNVLISDVEPEHLLTQMGLGLELRPGHPYMERLGGLSALIVKDKGAPNEAFQTLLTPLGTHITYVHTGPEALSALKSDVFDYIIMDIHSPALAGIDATKIIRMQETDNIHIPIIALLTHTVDQTRYDARAAGIDIILATPLNADALFEAIAAALTHQAEYKAFTQRIRAAD